MRVRICAYGLLIGRSHSEYGEVLILSRGAVGILPTATTVVTRESDVANTSQSHDADRIFLLAAVTAAMAAIFMVTIWAPLQLRALAQATEIAPLESRTAGKDDWLRVPFVTAEGAETSLGSGSGLGRGRAADGRSAGSELPPAR
jgi:hypothetical protein